ELRRAICSYYKSKFDYDFDQEMLIVGPGSKELLFQALFALEGPVIVPAPSWVSYGPQVNLRGKPITRVFTEEANSYKLTTDELKEVCDKLGKTQKILVLNTPNNPSGAVYTENEVEALAEICRENNVIVISDEIYAEVDFSFERKKGFFNFYPEGTIVTSGLSKAYSAGGYRLGFLATSIHLKNLIDALTSLISETFSAVSAPIQYSAVRAYEEDPEVEKYLHTCTLIHKACGEYMAKRFNEMGVSCPKPQGAFYLMPNFANFAQKLKENEAITTSKQLCELFLNKLNVAMLPGSDFYMPDELLCCRVASVDYDGAEVYKAMINARSNFEASEFVEHNCPNLKDGLDAIEQFLTNL
ncbi:MAG: aminotransferase class I/II-fold pyridoxal phosphate-dependent enzyme, partial [Bacteriovoracaceae bacterium]|nr:aminotransferase class I/II-fold pyridoxal phosphate-dependent enzyme [Bacteriovoracaceae bacterium]